ncbi:hypothetical protein FEP76_03997 [Burkholderia multivorans]|nr:hypothetical protein [Burkholderia multivorans]
MRDEPRELPIVADREKDRDGRRPVAVVRRDVRMRVAAALGHARRAEEIRQMWMQQRHAAVVQRDVDRLTAPALLALGEREQDAGERVEARHHVDDRQADARRVAVALAVHAHQPRHRLDHRVVARQAAKRPVGAETRHRTVDQPRETRLQIACIVHPPARERTGLEVLDQHVGVLEQPPEDRAPFVARQVEREPFLVAVHAQEVPRGVARERRPPAARLVAAGRFDLDDRRTVVGERLRAVRAAEHAAQVDDLQAFQCATRSVHRSTSGSRSSATSSDTGAPRSKASNAAASSSRDAGASGSTGRSLWRTSRCASARRR